MMAIHTLTLYLVFFCVGCIWIPMAYSQCPEFPSSAISGNDGFLCEGSSVTLSVTGMNLPPGSNVDWILMPMSTGNPYMGDGTLIGTVPVSSNACDNIPQVLYIMVNPDNTQVGGTGDQCDEFLVLWTGSGGYLTSDITVTNLGPGTFQWDSFIAGNAGSFSCGVPLPPGPVPPNAILIIQSSPNNNVFIDSDNLCASGLPVYIIAYDGTVSCTGGYFDNNSPCSSCPVIIDIDGASCQFDLNIDYQPPGSSIDGWGWANSGSGVFADEIPVVLIPSFIPPVTVIDDLVWTIPDDFCDAPGGGTYFITGIPDPPPPIGCMQITTPFFEIDVSCPELVLSGGGDVCAGNCPDDPATIDFTLIGNDTPFEVNLIVTASIFPPFPISGLSMVNGQSISVCLDGLFPTFDTNTGTLTIPTVAIGLTATVQVMSATSAAGCPVLVEQNTIMLHFIDAPTADAGMDQTICAHETAFLSGTIGGSATQGQWTTDGDGAFMNPGSPSPTYTPGPVDILNGQVTLTLTGMDANGACTPASSSVVITIEPSLFIEVNTPLTICNNDDAFIFALVTGGNAPCVWETTGDGTFLDPFSDNTIYTPGPSDITNGTVTLFFTPVNSDVCLAGSEPLVIFLVPAPIVMVPQNLEICDQDSVVIEINVAGAFSNIVWSTAGDGLLVIENDMRVTYYPGAMDMDDQFVIISVMIQSAFAACGLITYNIPVFVISCDCPPLITIPPTGPLCAESDMLDLSTLLLAGEAGAWSITGVPPGVNPASIVGNTFLTNMADDGIYTITYVLQTPEPGCPASSSEEIQVHPVILPFAGPDMNFCGPQSAMLNGLISQVAAVQVQWETSGDGTFSNPAVLNTVYTPGPADSLSTGVNIVLHLFDMVCGNQSDTISIFYHAPPFVLFANDTFTICNEAINGSVLDFYSLISGGDDGGIWANTSGLPIDFSNPASVNFDDIVEGVYLFQYRTNSATAPCIETQYDIYISVEDCLCPLLLVQNLPEGVCNSLPGLPLNAFIMSGGPGTWQVINTPPGANPATISGSTLVINGSDPGEYMVRFTLDAAPIDGCPDSVEIMVLVQGQPLVQVTGDAITCGQTEVELHAMTGGSANGIIWTTSGNGTFSNPVSEDPLYHPSMNDVASAQILLIATTTDTIGHCPAWKDTLVLQLVTPPSTTFSTLTATICNGPAGNSVLDLFSFITGGDGTGLWTDLDGAMVILTDPSQVDFVGVAPGMYRLEYTTQTAIPPCIDSSYIFTVLVEDCACPVLMIHDIDIDVCESMTIELQDLIVNAAPGSWTIASGPAGGNWPQIVGSTLIPLGAQAGNYILAYILTDSVAGCPASVRLPLSVEREPVITIVSIICNDTRTGYEVRIQTDGVSLSSDFGNVISSGPGQYLIDAVPSGQDIMLVVESATGLCGAQRTIPGPNCECNLEVEDIPEVISFCPGDIIILNPLVTGGHGEVIATWLTPQGMFVQSSLQLAASGQYIRITMDSLGCEMRDTFHVHVPDAGHLELGEDVTIEKGDSVLIQPIVSDIEISSVMWDPPFPGMVLQPFWYTPESTTMVSLIVTDTAGCVFSDELLITVVEIVRIYIPTIFSPNGDGINDEIIVHSSLSADRLISLEIFDRWGSLMHAQYGSFPLRWDGMSKGREMMTGVYVYKLTWHDDRGQVQVHVGDITLIR